MNFATSKDSYNHRLTSLLFNKIIDLPIVTLLPLKNLRTFLNSFNENTQALKVLNCDIVQDNPPLATLLLRKLDSDLRNKF